MCGGLHMGIVVRDKKFPSSTGICDVRYRIWAPEEPSACVQIIHGMAEHIERYHDFATFLAENNILVFGMDLPGHGKSIGKDMPKGYFGEKDGWNHLIRDNKPCMIRSWRIIRPRLAFCSAIPWAASSRAHMRDVWALILMRLFSLELPARIPRCRLLR